MALKKSPIVQTFEAVMPTAVSIACMILNVAPDTLITYRPLPDGGIVVITGPGQKFTFTAEDLAEQPKTVRARLVDSGITIIKPTRALPPEPDLADQQPSAIEKAMANLRDKNK